MASNKIACVHITREDIRLVEGRVNDGVILVTRTITIPKASRFFHGERLAYMSSMVESIVDAMNVNSFSAKTVHVVYDNNSDIEFYLDEKLERRRERSNNKKDKKKRKDDSPLKEKEQGTIVHKKLWGRFVTEAEMGELQTTVKMERDFVNFIVDAFQSHGLKVASLEVPETAVFYLRKMVPYSYDSLNKLVVYADNQTQGYYYQFIKDAPAGNKAVHFDEYPAANFAERVAGLVREEIERSNLGNPHIMLVGDAFANPKDYLDCCQYLREDGLLCIDTYGLWHDRSAPVNSVRIVTPRNAGSVDLNGKYGICISLLLRTLDPKPENMIEGFHPMLIGEQAKRSLMNIAVMLSIMFVIYAGASAGVGWYEVQQADTEFQRLHTISETKLSAVERDRDEVKAQVDNLATIDERYNSIFKFVYAQVDENLNIASVDTENLIPVPEVTESNYAEGEEGSESPSAEGEEVVADVTAKAPLEFTQQIIVIRGYSRTTSEPVELYNNLVSAGLGNVKIVGIEQVPLPSDEMLFAFELTVGIDEGV